jgi:hypothetical protein
MKAKTQTRALFHQSMSHIAASQPAQPHGHGQSSADHSKTSQPTIISLPRARAREVRFTAEHSARLETQRKGSDVSIFPFDMEEPVLQESVTAGIVGLAWQSVVDRISYLSPNVERQRSGSNRQSVLLEQVSSISKLLYL